MATPWKSWCGEQLSSASGDRQAWKAASNAAVMASVTPPLPAMHMYHCTRLPASSLRGFTGTALGLHVGVISLHRRRTDSRDSQSMLLIIASLVSGLVFASAV